MKSYTVVTCVDIQYYQVYIIFYIILDSESFISNTEKDDIYFSIVYGEGKLGLNISISPKLHLPVLLNVNHQINFNTYSCIFSLFKDKESETIIYSVDDEICMNITELDEIRKIIINHQKPIKITYLRRNFTQYFIFINIIL